MAHGARRRPRDVTVNSTSFFYDFIPLVAVVFHGVPSSFDRWSSLPLLYTKRIVDSCFAAADIYRTTARHRMQRVEV